MESFKIKSQNPLQGITIRDVFGDNYSSNANSNKINGFVFSCLDITAKYFTKTKLRLYKKQANGLKEIVSHPFLDLIDYPSDLMTRWEMLYMMILNLGYDGNHYLIKNRSVLGIPAEIVMPDPKSVRVERASDGRPKYTYMTTKGEIDIPFWNMIHVKYPGPNNSLVGKPIISYFIDQVDVEKYQIEYQRKFYKEGGFLGATFTTSQDLSPSSFSRAKTELESRYGNGINNAFKVALFDNGLSPVKSAYSLKDMDIKNSRDSIRDEITASFQVPKVLMGLGENTNRASAEAVLYAFASGVIDPISLLFSEVLSKHVRNDFGVNYLIKADSQTPKDVQSDMQFFSEMFKMGAITVNEIRVGNDYEKYPVEVADHPLINVGGSIVDLTKPTSEIIAVGEQKEPKSGTGPKQNT